MGICEQGTNEHPCSIFFCRFSPLSVCPCYAVTHPPVLSCLLLHVISSTILSLPCLSAHTEGHQPLVWFDHGRFYLAFEGESSHTIPIFMPPVHGLNRLALL